MKQEVDNLRTKGMRQTTNTQKLLEREKIKFPSCIGMFNDLSCKNSTKENPGEDCLKCPFYK